MSEITGHLNIDISQEYTRSVSVSGTEEEENDWKINAGERIRVYK